MAFRLVLLAAVVLVGTCSYGMPQNFNFNPEQFYEVEARSSSVDAEVPEPAFPTEQESSEDDRQDRKLKLIKLAALGSLVGLKGLTVLPAAALAGGSLGVAGGIVANGNANNGNGQLFLSQPQQPVSGITGGSIVFGLPSVSKVNSLPGITISGDAINNLQNNVGALGQNLLNLGPNAAAVGNSVTYTKGIGGSVNPGNAGIILNANARAGDAAQEVAAQSEASADSAEKPAQQFYYVSAFPQYVPYSFAYSTPAYPYAYPFAYPYFPQ